MECKGALGTCRLAWRGRMMLLRVKNDSSHSLDVHSGCSGAFSEDVIVLVLSMALGCLSMCRAKEGTQRLPLEQAGISMALES